MPALGPLALRYFLWLLGLRVLYSIAVSLLGVPNSLSTTVILASAPAIDIGMQVLRRSSAVLHLSDWARVWGMMFATYLFVFVGLPALAIPGFRMALMQADGLQAIATTAAATGAMLGLFLYLGTRAGARRDR